MSFSTSRSAAILAALLLSLAAGAAQAQAPADDPVVAKVGDEVIRLSDVRDAAETLPHDTRSVPPQTLLPMLLDQMIDGMALSAEARRTGLDKDPVVQRQVRTAAERALETALLQKEIRPLITDEAVKARYDQDIAGKPSDSEVHARHILVTDEATAKKIIGELKKGGDFVKLSAEFSKDPGAAKQGGDLGFFGKNDMVPEFAAAAFSMKDGEVSANPVHTQFGWHVIQVIERRQKQAQPFDQAKEELRQKMIQDGVQAIVTRARATVSVEKFNLDGSRPKATDMAEPPAAK